MAARVRPVTLGGRWGASGEQVAVNFDLHDDTVDSANRRQEMMVPGQVVSGWRKWREEPHVAELPLCTNGILPGNEYVEVRERTESRIFVDECDQRRTLEDRGLDSDTLKGLEDLREGLEPHLVASSMAEVEHAQHP